MPYPGTELYEKARREGLLADEDWSRMEYSYYMLRGNGLDERVVMGAINRAKRRFSCARAISPATPGTSRACWSPSDT